MKKNTMLKKIKCCVGTSVVGIGTLTACSGPSPTNVGKTIQLSWMGDTSLLQNVGDSATVNVGGNATNVNLSASGEGQGDIWVFNSSAKKITLLKQVTHNIVVNITSTAADAEPQSLSINIITGSNGLSVEANKYYLNQTSNTCTLTAKVNIGDASDTTWSIPSAFVGNVSLNSTKGSSVTLTYDNVVPVSLVVPITATNNNSNFPISITLLSPETVADRLEVSQSSYVLGISTDGQASTAALTAITEGSLDPAQTQWSSSSSAVTLSSNTGANITVTYAIEVAQPETITITAANSGKTYPIGITLLPHFYQNDATTIALQANMDIMSLGSTVMINAEVTNEYGDTTWQIPVDSQNYLQFVHENGSTFAEDEKPSGNTVYIQYYRPWTGTEYEQFFPVSIYAINNNVETSINLSLSKYSASTNNWTVSSKLTTLAVVGDSTFLSAIGGVWSDNYQWKLENSDNLTLTNSDSQTATILYESQANPSTTCDVYLKDENDYTLAAITIQILYVGDVITNYLQLSTNSNALSSLNETATITAKIIGSGPSGLSDIIWSCTEPTSGAVIFNSDSTGHATLTYTSSTATGSDPQIITVTAKLGGEGFEFFINIIIHPVDSDSLTVRSSADQINVLNNATLTISSSGQFANLAETATWSIDTAYQQYIKFVGSSTDNYTDTTAVGSYATISYYTPHYDAALTSEITASISNYPSSMSYTKSIMLLPKERIPTVIGTQTIALSYTDYQGNGYVYYSLGYVKRYPTGYRVDTTFSDLLIGYGSGRVHASFSFSLATRSDNIDFNLFSKPTATEISNVGINELYVATKQYNDYLIEVLIVSKRRNNYYLSGVCTWSSGALLPLVDLFQDYKGASFTVKSFNTGGDTNKIEGYTYHQLWESTTS